MVFGRVLGWLLMGVAVIMASADAVMALGPAEYAGIMTGDVLTLLSGRAPDASSDWSLLALAESLVLELPVWIAVGLAATTLLVTCRKRPRRWVFRSR